MPKSGYAVTSELRCSFNIVPYKALQVHLTVAVKMVLSKTKPGAHLVLGGVAVKTATPETKPAAAGCKPPRPPMRTSFG